MDNASSPVTDPSLADTHGSVWNFDTGRYVRPATPEEEARSIKACGFHYGAGASAAGIFIENGERVFWD